MKSLSAFFIFFVAFSIALFGQDSSKPREKNNDDVSDKLEKIIEDIVDSVTQQIEQMSEQRDGKKSVTIENNSSDDEGEGKTKADAVTFNGDTEVAEKDTIGSDIVVKNGTLTIRGVVKGDAVVFNGTIKIINTGIVKGNARAINGSIEKAENAVVEGYTEETSGVSTSKKKKTQRTQYSYSFKPYAWWNNDELLDEHTMFRYNRVEGLFLGFGSEKKYYWDGSKTLIGHGSVGYGFGMHKWRLQLGIDRQFAASDALYEIGSEMHSLTDSKDEWIMQTGENTATSLLVREDYRDYFQREGFSVHTARYTRENYATLFDVRYSYDRYKSLENSVNWSLFGGKKSFRNNPIISEGIMRSVKVSAGLSTVEKFRRISEGWNLFSSVEYAGSQLGGDFNFTDLLVDIRRYQPLTGSDQVSARVRVGALEGDLLQQRALEIGGANTMPGFSFKEFAGNRMILANLEYLNYDLLDDIFFWPSNFNFIVFGDAGIVTTVAAKKKIYEGFETFNKTNIKSDVGFAIGFGSDTRLGFAWRTDVRAPVSVFFRFNRAF